MSGGIKVEGLKETVRDLQKIGIEVADLKAAFLPISMKAADEIRTVAPKRTGALLKSIKPSKAKNYAAVSIGSKAKVPYAAWQNYSPKSPNRFFAQRGSAKVEPFAYKEIEEALNKLIQEKF